MRWRSRSVTVEGLAADGVLDPVQAAIIDHGGVQCGFCTPGILISARGLLNRQPNPSDDEIRQALVGNLCRCTGYLRIVDAVKDAAQRCRGALRCAPTGGSMTTQSNQIPHPIGDSVPRVDAHEKVIGAALFADDLQFGPGMLYARIKRSPIPHGRIIRIDTQKRAPFRGSRQL